MEIENTSDRKFIFPEPKTEIAGYINLFKKILKCKDGRIWHLTENEVLEWERDGSIKSGDILYQVVTEKKY